MPACRTLAALLNRTHVFFVFLVKQIQLSFVGIYMSVASVSARIYTVKEIDSARYPLENICRCSHAHQIRRLVFRKIRNGLLYDLIHLFMGFSHCKSANCIPIQIQFRNSLCMVHPDIRKNCSLVNSKQQLLFINRIFQTVQTLHFFFAPLQPAGRTRNRIFDISALCHTRWTLVKCHGNRRSEV